jgi:hypothetical protein
MKRAGVRELGGFKKIWNARKEFWKAYASRESVFQHLEPEQ